MNSFVRMTLASVMVASLAGCASTGPGTKRNSYSSADKARMLVQVASGALSENDPTGALENLLRAEAEDASVPEIYHVRALAFHAKHDPVAALANARKAVKLAPDFSDASSTLGRLLMDHGDLDEAIPYLSRAANDPLYRDAYKPLTSLGIVHFRRNQLSTSKDYLDRAIEASPLAACVAYYYRGQVQARTSRIPLAIRDYQAATTRLCAGFVDAHLALGMAFEQSKQYTAARKKYLEIEKLYPSSKAADEAVNHLRYLP